jgi:glucosamine-6-phosphate deaminase
MIKILEILEGASNQPGEALTAPTHRAVLAEETRRSNAYLFDGQIDRVPTEALSGHGGHPSGQEILLMATGQSKATAVERMVKGPVTTHLPASLLQLHGDVQVVLDEAAAARIMGGRSDSDQGWRDVEGTA